MAKDVKRETKSNTQFKSAAFAMLPIFTVAFLQFLCFIALNFCAHFSESRKKNNNNNKEKVSTQAFELKLSHSLAK